MLARLALAVCLAFAATTAGAAEIILRPTKRIDSANGSLSIDLKGPIVPGDAERLTAALDAAATKAPRNLLGVFLDSPGGDLREGIKLGRVVKARGASAWVRAGSTCASACFLAFAASPTKFVNQGSRIGIHGASVNGVETAEAMAGTVVMARIAADYGIPDAIVGRLVKTPGDRILWLSPDELQQVTGSLVIADEPRRTSTTPQQGAIRF